MKAYKAFDKDLSCTSGGNRFQYQLEKWNEEPEANCAENGFHCAENPLDCLTYYSDWDNARYFAVEAVGDIDEDAADSKISCTRMMLLQELDMETFLKAAVAYIRKHPLRKYGCHSKKIQAVKNSGAAVQEGGLIVRGLHPEAIAASGALIVLIKEDAAGNIERAVMFRGIEGQRYEMNETGQIVRVKS